MGEGLLSGYDEEMSSMMEEAGYDDAFVEHRKLFDHSVVQLVVVEVELSLTAIQALV
jgi:hypothetical protein